jgi:toxin ParE1/3/4
MGTIRRTVNSRRDYGDIWAFVADQNPIAAGDLLRSFDEALRLLSDFPRAGPQRPELRRRLRSYPVGNYLLFYRPIRGGIELLRVVHGSRDLRVVFKRRKPYGSEGTDQ